ncbi:MAG TPA: hypothetical protein VH189_11135, partial [Rhizomicrobium sp.]|nr:hypothetical protein [Rhizomicrobium sp.]
MKKLVIALASALAFALAGFGFAAADTPTAKDIAPKMPQPVAAFEWAYPVSPPNLPRPDPNASFTATGADPSIKLTMRQIGDSFGPPDWFPHEHPPLPEIVAHGLKPHVV